MTRSAKPYDIVKRVLDFIVGLKLLVILSPLLIVLAVLVRVRLGSPVIFAQQRPGRNGAPFTVYKFRSMRDADPGLSQTDAVLTDASRLTPFGRRLRASSLDELPELVNIILGDMSFVGPRPLLTEYLDRYNERQARRHEVRPGITGWAQVNGRNAASWDDRLEMDVYYVEHRSLLLDARILWRTVATVFSREGVSAPGQATVEPFRGSQDTDGGDA